MEYFATLGGGSLFPFLPFPEVTAAATAGALILILAAVAVLLALREGKLASYSFWIALIGYGILVQAQITVSRCGFGTPQALSSRYAVTSLLTVIGLYGLLSSLGHGENSTLGVGAVGRSFLAGNRGPGHVHGGRPSCAPLNGSGGGNTTPSCSAR